VKDEKNPKKGSEKELEIICRKAVGAFFFCNNVPFVS